MVLLRFLQFINGGRIWRRKEGRVVGDEMRMSDALWERIEPLLPLEVTGPKGGRPWRSPPRLYDGILYVLGTGCQWKSMPRTYGAPSAVYDRYQRWVKDGVFERLWKQGLDEYDELRGIQWDWQAMDGAKTKAPLGG